MDLWKENEKRLVFIWFATEDRFNTLSFYTRGNAGEALCRGEEWSSNVEIHVGSLKKVRALSASASFSRVTALAGPCVGPSSLSASRARSGEGSQPWERTLPARHR